LRGAATAAHALLVGDDCAVDEAVDAATLLGAARHALGPVAVHDADLARLAERVAEAGYLVVDVAADLSSYAGSIDADPLRLAALAERRAALRHLTRKYGPSVDDVLAWSKQAAERLRALDNDDDRLARLEEQRAELRVELGAVGAELSAAREQAAGRFAAAVTAEIAALAMPAARVELTVDQRDDPAGIEVRGRTVAFGRHGVDDVEILLAGHAGAPLRPLQKGASGGELSRVMLAVEVVFAGADPVPTFVFDEVDAGVGGRAAVEIGRRLARLARSAQVVVVTHLPQVAAYADRHLLVAKSAEGAVTSSGVTTLGGEARVRELARMLAGQEGSRTGVAHARELLRTARDDAAGPVS
jgi:DNA repair protein RecN (Recombination protein N)